MRVAYVYDSVYPWESGGIQKRVWELGRRLSDRHDVHWYGLKYWDGPATIEREGVTLHGVMEPPALYHDGRRSIHEALSFSTHLLRPLLEQEFDVIDCQEFPFFPVFTSKIQTLRFRSELVLTWHEIWDDYWYEYLGWKGVFGKVVERLAAQAPDRHLAVSDRTSLNLERLGVDNATVVPNGIDMGEIDRIDPASGTSDILYVGRLIPEKNVELLVQAVDHIRDTEPDVRCVIVGDGPERESIESLISENGLEDAITLTGRLEEYEEVLARMKAAEIFALPSRREGFGISALEALACGTPVVTIAHPQNAAQELIQDGVTGSICEQSRSSFADGIIRARGASQSACRSAASAYDWDNIAEQAETIYEDTIS